MCTHFTSPARVSCACVCRKTVSPSPVDGVHPGVARSLGRLVVLSERRTPSHPDAAELRPCHPDRVTPTALRERCRSHKELCLEVLAVGHEVGHKDKHLRRRWR